ncbi:hypothetical protein M0802_006154 [Mischocyttarus mexicanus]|nr:hypothetical protein M0802_006154 [Mischocyttarus mexicanus]
MLLYNDTGYANVKLCIKPNDIQSALLKVKKMMSNVLDFYHTYINRDINNIRKVDRSVAIVDRAHPKWKSGENIASQRRRRYVDDPGTKRKTSLSSSSWTSLSSSYANRQEIRRALLTLRINKGVNTVNKTLDKNRMLGQTSTRESSEVIRMEPLGRTSSSRSPGQNGTANSTEVPVISAATRAVGSTVREKPFYSSLLRTFERWRHRERTRPTLARMVETNNDDDGNDDDESPPPPPSNPLAKIALPAAAAAPVSPAAARVLWKAAISA